MAKRAIGGTIIFVATVAAFAFGASLPSAAGGGLPGSSGSHQGGVLAPAASPYAILAPVTLENTPGGEGRAAFEGRPSLCLPGAHEVATNSGIRCKPDR